MNRSSRASSLLSCLLSSTVTSSLSTELHLLNLACNQLTHFTPLHRDISPALASPSTSVTLHSWADFRVTFNSGWGPWKPQMLGYCKWPGIRGSSTCVSIYFMIGMQLKASKSDVIRRAMQLEGVGKEGLGCPTSSASSPFHPS